jgi:hypothetical protein
LRILIFKDYFCAIVLRIHKDLLDSSKQVESLKNDWIRDHESNPRTKSFENSKDSDLGIFLESGFANPNPYESMDS